MNSLENQNVVIIGGTSGIGLAAAIMASTAGARVWAASRSKDRISQCQADHPGITFCQLDTHDVDGLKSLFESVGSIDHLVGAATGADRTIAPFMDQTHEQFSEAFNKFWGYTHVARQGVPYLTETGSLTLVSGSPARKYGPNMSALGCTGAAVENLSRFLAAEIAPKRVNVVAPGTIATGMWEAMPEERRNAMFEAAGSRVPLGRVGTSEEVADSIIHVMTNPYITGATIDVNGGQFLG